MITYTLHHYLIFFLYFFPPLFSLYINLRSPVHNFPKRTVVEESPNVRNTRRTSYSQAPKFQMSEALSSIGYGERKEFPGSSMDDSGDGTGGMVRYGSLEKSDSELYNMLSKVPNMSSVSIDNDTAHLISGSGNGSESGSLGQTEKKQQPLSASAASLSFGPEKSNEGGEYSDEDFEDSQQSETSNYKVSAELKLFGSVGNNPPIQIHRR